MTLNTTDENISAKIWKCLIMCNTIIILILNTFMFIAGAVVWKVLSEHFGIADNIDTVICYKCVRIFTLATSILAIGSAVIVFTFIGFFAAKFHKFNFGVVIAFTYTMALILAIIIVITAPIWLDRQSNILQRFEDSSKVSFQNQMSNETIRDIWDNYQERFGCCGVRNYRDYYTYFGRNYSIPLSCCNLTTLLPADIDCSTVVKNVTEEDVSSYYIYGSILTTPRSEILASILYVRRSLLAERSR